nr:hypothetical protein [Candidatus Sigynarchaeota archaeon]
MDGRSRKIAFVQICLLASLVSSYFITIAAIQTPSDYLPDRLSRIGRRGDMYGYVFLSWDQLMANQTVADQYMDLVAQCLDFCYVHCQWNGVAKDNDTLDLDYLGNLSAFISGLGSRGVSVVIHVWVSSYTPSWMYPYVPEVVGQDDRWQGIDPATMNATALQHRQALKWSMIRYQQLLCQYFIGKGLGSNIKGFCLDDEPQSEYWLDLFQDLTDVIHGFNSSWETMAMFNRIDKYHMTGDAGMDVHAMDPYDQDGRFIEKITYAYQVSGVDKISVLIDAMGAHDDVVFHAKMRRQAWIAWFMGADSIGWYTFLYGNNDWACAISRYTDGLGPGITAKTNATIETAIDVDLLNQAYAKISGTSNPVTRSVLTSKLLAAYAHAKLNEFIEARALLEEVLA